MRVSLNWVKKYVDLPKEITNKQLSYDLTMRTVEVEDVIDTSLKFHDIIVGEILEVNKHPDADKLKVCMVNIGEESPVQIVCGGSNLYVGEKVVISKPGAEVYWHGEGDLVKIKETKMRGVSSYGMICGATEVYLEDYFPPKDESEIVDLSEVDCKPGDNIADIIGMNDTVLEIDNKSLTNRPDLWGHYGIARELSAIYKVPLKELEIIKPDKNIKKYNIEIKDNIVTAEAGVSLIYLANLCMNNNLNGLAFAGGIPGMVGASTAMNAGAYKEDMASIVKEVKVVTPELEVIRLTNKDLNYSYRNSFLKEHKDYICTEVTLEMSYLDKDKIKETMTSRKKRRIDTQPLDKPSAGSVFRNPEGLSAGKLIEDAGLKGYKIGGAEISTKHANFIVNTGDTTYEDILELIDYTNKKIKEIYNIDLILEQEIIR